MAIKCKEFRSGLIKDVSEPITKFLAENKITEKRIVSIQYSSSATGTYALIFYKTKK